MSSEKILNQKKSIVNGLTEEFKSAQTLVLADYLGLTVAEDTELRNNLREAGVTYKVIKNTMGVLAAREAGLDGLEEIFKGSTAIAYSNTDIIAPAKVLKKFSKDHPDYVIKGGASAGEVVSLDELMALADIPDLPILYGKLVGSLISPIAGLAMLVKAIAEKAEEAGANTAADVVVGAEPVQAVAETTTEEDTEAAGDEPAETPVETAEEATEDAPVVEETTEPEAEKEEAPAEEAAE